MLDADVRSYFDRVSHDWMLRFLGHRIADIRMLALIRKWLKAGVLERWVWAASEEGTPQGSSISPLLANVYLHYVLDLWAHQWRKRHARGDVIIVRWADDFVVGFQHEDDAMRFRLGRHCATDSSGSRGNSIRIRRASSGSVASRTGTVGASTGGGSRRPSTSSVSPTRAGCPEQASFWFVAPP